MKTAMIILIIVLLFLGVVIIHRKNQRSGDGATMSIREKLAERRDNNSSPSAMTLGAGANFASGPGAYEYTLKSGDETRKYMIFVPSSYDKGQGMPLVLFFHGGGGHMEQAASDYQWQEKAEKEGLIVAFPNGSSRLPRQHLATWNAGSCCGYARDQKIDDVSFVKQVIADIQSKFHINTDQIFATGMSNGGMMAHTLACQMADTFKAVASVAGTDGNQVCNPSRPISVMHIHAKDDTHVLFGGGAGEGSFRDESQVTDFTSVEETVNRWIVRDQLEKTPKRVLEVPGAYADLYTSKQNNAQVEVVVTETGGHSWPGMKIVRGKNPSKAIVANDIIWDFFRSQQ